MADSDDRTESFPASGERSAPSLDKKRLAAQLAEAGRLLELLGDDPNRARAFGSAARNLEGYEGDVAPLLREGRLTEIRGVGATLAAELSAEPGEDGALPFLSELRGRVPQGVRDLFRVSGLGVKKIKALWEAGIDGLEPLIDAIDEGRVQELKGFGARSAAGFRDGAAFALRAARRWRLDAAEALGEALVDALTGALPGARVAVAGELRRRCETVGRLELVVAAPDPGAALALVRTLVRSALGEGARETREEGATALELQQEGRPVRITVVAAESFGAALALRTGGEAFAAALRERARERGLELTAGGLRGDDGAVAAPDEAALFARLERSAPQPELREAADAEPVAGLLEPGDVRGLVHNHTTWSDAVHSLREMVAAARALGYAWLVIADHSRTSYYANGLSIERLRQQAAEIREIRTELADEGSDFELLHGCEVDILPDGSLDYPDEVLAELDVRVVAVHQNFTLSEAEQTERIVRAASHPLADILAHPTGRLLLRRPPYDVDVDAVIDACAAAGTVIEINANPYRLDLDWRWLRRARERGCRFSVDPDAHHVDHYAFVRHGVAMARKGGLTADDVVACAPTGREFLARLAELKGR